MQGQSGIFQEFQKHIEPQSQEHVMTIAESLIDQGLQQGRQEGEAACESLMLYCVTLGLLLGRYEAYSRRRNPSPSLFTSGCAAPRDESL